MLSTTTGNCVILESFWPHALLGGALTDTGTITIEVTPPNNRAKVTYTTATSPAITEVGDGHYRIVIDLDGGATDEGDWCYTWIGATPTPLTQSKGSKSSGFYVPARPC